MIELPGGVQRPDGSLVRTVHLAPLTGRFERLVLSAEEPGSVPERVSAALAVVLEVPGMASLDAARAVTVGDRRWLLRRMLAEIDGPVRWHTSRCDACGEAFDVPVDVRELPTARATDGAIQREVALSSDVVTVRVLTGADEEAAVAGGDAATLAERLAALAVDGDHEQLSSADVGVIGDALDDLGPSPVTTIATACPACEAPAYVDVDPYRQVGRGDDALLDDVHRIASTYHWPQDAILAMPTRRRRRYLARIDAARGVRA